jgi:photosystem II stability/assembly factor-like uncharacterized protein
MKPRELLDLILPANTILSGQTILIFKISLWGDNIMKKSILFLFMLLLINTNLFSQTPQYYNYDTAGINNYFPFNVQSGKQVQWLILPGEFNRPSPIPSGKIITAVYFFMAYTASKQLWHLNISLGQTTLTSLPAGDIYRGPLTTVYYRTNDVLNSSAGTWMRIILDTPFPYDTSLSLVIDVSQCASSGSGSMALKQTALSGIRRNANNFAAECNYYISYQDSSVANCGVDVVFIPYCTYYWGNQNSNSIQTLYSVRTVNNLVGWAAGAGGTIIRTTDGGVTWTNCNLDESIIIGEIGSIEALNADTAFCTAKSTEAAFIYRTLNGGANWTQVLIQNNGFINAIHFVVPYYGYAVSNPVNGKWMIWYTYNCGVYWDTLRTIVQNGNEEGWNNSMAFSGNYGWFGTNNSRVYKTYNPVCVWQGYTTPGLVNSRSVHFNSNTLGLAGGSSLVRSTDGGIVWQNIGPVPGNGEILGIEGSGTDFWYIRGTNIYRSSNSGDTWSLCYTGTDTLYDINFSVIDGCPAGWAVGENGRIVKMSEDSLIGIRNYDNSVPAEYKLYQNYPNPFNPVTKIKFDIPSNVKRKTANAPLSSIGEGPGVRLVIYDILGREVANLIPPLRGGQEGLQPGTYSVTWDASNFPSGVYFYTLKCSDFSVSKKMLLIK